MGSVVNQLAFLPPTHPKEEFKELTTYEKIKTKSKNEIVALWLYEEENDYTILYSHGNAEDLITSQDCYRNLSFFLCVNILAYDYEGYGLSSGQSSEQATYDDIESAYRWLTEDDDGPTISPEKIILFGRSLGSGPTIHLAAKKDNLAGLILQSPLRSAIKTQFYNWVANTILSSADIFHNERKIVNVKNYPVLIIHGKEDRVVPFSHGEYLYQQVKKNSKCEVRYHWVEGCGHNDIEARRPDEYHEKLLKFVEECIRNANESKEAEAEAEEEKKNEDDKEPHHYEIKSKANEAIDDDAYP